MNSFLCSVGQDLDEKIDLVPNPLLSAEYDINQDEAKFHFRAIKVQEIRGEFFNIKTAKNVGIDDNNFSYFLKLAIAFL